MAELLETILLPSQLDIGKCAVHTNDSDPVSCGNTLADSAAKQAIISSPSIIHQCPSTQPVNRICLPSFNDVVEIQNRADDRERNL